MQHILQRMEDLRHPKVDRHFLKKDLEKKSLFNSIVRAIKEGDELKLTELTNKIPKYKIEDIIWKLERYKYKRFRLTKVAISQLKWRRGY